MPFELLSAPIRKYIRDKRWEALRPIQAAAITKISTTSDNYILASRTASGKTEAAFLPILSQVNFNEPGIQVLYISPLIALINDQFLRIEELSTYLDIPVTKWHGEASKSAKEKLLKRPEGMVLITPESLEAMFVNKPYQVKHLFSQLKFVVIDEIHSFIGTDRGIQLKSILSRMQAINQSLFRIIGLSATIGNYTEAKKFTGRELHTKVLLDKTAKEIEVVFRYFEVEGDELTPSLLMNLYEETKDNKVLLFPNSRGRAEEVAVKLKKLSQKFGGHENYFSHHSSVNKEVREYVEYFVKNNKRANFLIACTSTLELGIDIGTVDEVVQIDATHSIASLIQRVGRSGRREGEKSYLFLYATNPWSLLQSLACYTLYTEGFIEPPIISQKPYDILLHQALSVVKGHSGIGVNELIRQLRENFAFIEINEIEIQEILNHLLQFDLLEKLQHELIIGLEGEKIVNSKEFYSVFKTEENLKLVHAGNTIGEIPFSLQVKENENILLAAGIWKIKSIDLKAKRIEVIRANDGKKPLFFGSGASIHPHIRQRMLELLFGAASFDFLEETAKAKLSEMKSEFACYKLTDVFANRPMCIHEKTVQLFTFTGTRINRTLAYLLDRQGINHSVEEKSSSIKIELEIGEFLNRWPELAKPINLLDEELEKLILSNPILLDFSKWGIHLPLKYQVQLLKDRYFDFPGTYQFLTHLQIITNK